MDSNFSFLFFFGGGGEGGGCWFQEATTDKSVFERYVYSTVLSIHIVL